MKVLHKILFAIQWLTCASSVIIAEMAPVTPPVTPPVTLDTMLNKTLDTWTTVDLVRSIAREERHHLYPRLIKDQLDLYATTYWFTGSQPQQQLPAHYLADISEMFAALTTAQKDTLTGQSISDNGQASLLAWNPTLEVTLQNKSIGGLFSCMIMDQTNALWNKFAGSASTNPTKSSEHTTNRPSLG